MHFFDPQQRLHVRRTGDHFVDDCANGTNKNTITNELTVLQQLQKDEQFHAHALCVLAHKLAINKCRFYLATFQRKGILHKHKNINQEAGIMNIQETFSSDPAPVRRLEPHQSYKSLGCLITIDGSQEEQFDVVLKKVLQWKDRVRGSTLTNDERYIAYDSYLKKSMQYALASTSFTTTQCHELDKHIAPIILNAANTQHNCSRIILYCPEKYRGIGFADLWSLQGIEKFDFFS